MNIVYFRIIDTKFYFHLFYFFLLVLLIAYFICQIKQLFYKYSILIF